MNKALVKPHITRDTVIQYALITLGALVYALGQLFFIKPLHIPMGGINGISLVLNYAFSLPAVAPAGRRSEDQQFLSRRNASAS